MTQEVKDKDIWIAVYIDCVGGKFVPFGPFSSKKKAHDFIDTHEETDSWNAFKVELA